MKTKDRYLVELLKGRMTESEPLIQVMTGPRQIGKTTALLAALGEKGIYHTADYPTPLDVGILEDWWAEAEADSSRLLAVDEIQKIPRWSEMLKKLWDGSSGMRVIVTGSTSLLVEKGLRESLAGRFELIRADHWNHEEAQDVFGIKLEKFIEFGFYPGAARFLDDPVRWGEYVRDAIVEPALGRDLLQLHPVGSPALLRQLFGVAVALPAQIISLQKLQGNLQGKGSLPTIGNYLQLLADAFVVSSLQKYSPTPYRVKKSTPKLIMHDNALIRAFERPIRQDLPADRFGRYFENAVGARFIESGWETYYWKHRDLEVDFVVIGPENQHWAIEVKTAKTKVDDLKGLFEFTRNYPDFDPCLVSLASQEIEGVMSLDPAEILSLRRER